MAATTFNQAIFMTAAKKNHPRTPTALRDQAELQELHLGKKTAYIDHYDPTLLEAFPNKTAKGNWTSLICPEFTSLCPKTGQPDFGVITINYMAKSKMVESKSLKLYLFSFRNTGEFHEDVVNRICQDLVKLLDPYYLEVRGEFNPRGGIRIYPFAQYADASGPYQRLKQQRMAAYQPGSYHSR
jgi:7-cyano-7-deazaguanine reductase